MRNSDILYDMENIGRAEAVAYEVFQGHNKYPVNPIDISEQMGIQVYEATFDDNIQGILHREGDKWEIFVDKNLSSYRKRFVIAHELGHYYMHQESAPQVGVIIDYKSTVGEKGLNQQEEEANTFAYALLMNKEETQTMWEKFGSIPLLASYFGVSNDAVITRLKSLELISE